MTPERGPPPPASPPLPAGVILQGNVNMQLPNLWLWEMIDEFCYQFQSFCTYRSKLGNRSPEEVELLKACGEKARGGADATTTTSLAQPPLPRRAQSWPMFAYSRARTPPHPPIRTGVERHWRRQLPPGAGRQVRDRGDPREGPRNASIFTPLESPNLSCC